MAAKKPQRRPPLLGATLKKLKRNPSVLASAWSKRYFALEDRLGENGRELVLAYYESEEHYSNPLNAKQLVWIRDIREVQSLADGRRADELISGLSEVPLEDSQIKAIAAKSTNMFEINARRDFLFLRGDSQRQVNQWVSSEPPIAPKYILMLQGTPASPIARLPTHQRRSVGRPLTDVLSKQTPVLVNSRSQASMSDANDSDSDDIGEAFPIDSDKTHPANSHQTAKRKAAETARRTKPAAAASRSKAVFSEKVTLVQSSPVRVVSNQAEEHEGRTEPTQDSVCDDLAYMTPAKSKAADACPDSGLSIEHEVLTERPQLELVHDSNSQDEVDQLSLDAMEEVVIEADDGSPIHYQHNQRKRGELGKVDLSLPTDLGFESSAGEGKDAEDVHFNATHTLGLPTQARSGQIASVLLNSPTRPSVPQPTPAEESEKKDDWDDWDGDTEQPKEQKESAPPKPASRPMPKGPQPQRVGRPLPPSARPKPGAAPARGGGAASGRARLLMQQRRHSQQRNPPPARQQASDSKIQDAGAAVDDDFVTADWDE